MMPRGRPPKPATVAYLSGDPGKRHRYKTEPAPATGIPTCPEYLNAIAKAEWAAITKLLKDMGLLSRSDRTALELYCQAYSDYRTASEQVSKYGSVILSPNKAYPMVSPYATARNTAFEQVRKFLIEFGLTPAARARMSVPSDSLQQPGADKWNFLSNN